MPNDWQKQTASAKHSSPTERDERYQEFFLQVRDILQKEHQFSSRSHGNVQPRNWIDFGSGYRGVWYGAAFSSGGRVHVNVSIDRGEAHMDWNIILFNSLLACKESIEAELSEQLEWEQPEGRRACRITLRRNGSIYDEPDSLEEVRAWMVERLLAFKRVFGPHLAELVE